MIIHELQYFSVIYNYEYSINNGSVVSRFYCLVCSQYSTVTEYFTIDKITKSANYTLHIFCQFSKR